jgi:hypothetical protein
MAPLNTISVAEDPAKLGNSARISLVLTMVLLTTGLPFRYMAALLVNPEPNMRTYPPVLNTAVSSMLA